MSSRAGAGCESRGAIFTVPKALRRLFLRERRLLGLLPRCAAEAATRCWRAVLDRRDGVPGVVASIQTFGGLESGIPMRGYMEIVSLVLGVATLLMFVAFVLVSAIAAAPGCVMSTT